MGKKQFIQQSSQENVNSSNHQQGQNYSDSNSAHQKNNRKQNLESGAKSGRPPKEKQIKKQRFEIKSISSTSGTSHQIKQKLTEFYHSIQKKNGLALSQAIRLRVNKERKQAGKHQFNQKNKRKYNTEKQKLQKTLKNFEHLKKLAQQPNGQQMSNKILQFRQKIFSIIYESCGIFPQEFTAQIYKYFVEILNILYKFINENEKIETSIQKFANSIAEIQNQEYQYLNFNFGKNSKVKQIKLDDQYRHANKHYFQITLNIAKVLLQYLHENSEQMFYKSKI